MQAYAFLIAFALMATATMANDVPCEHDEECPSEGGKCALFPKCVQGKCVQQFRKTHHRCHKSNSPCQGDVYCTGTSTACPVDTMFKPATTVCHAATACSDAVLCTGHSAECPAHDEGHLKPPGTVCRKSRGECEEDAVCDGKTPKCPAETFKPNTAVCRASTGVCDAEEKCSGHSAHCPADAFKPQGTVCRAKSATNKCDLHDEVCSGKDATCPAKNEVAEKGYSYKCDGHETLYMCGAPIEATTLKDGSKSKRQMGDCYLGKSDKIVNLAYPACLNMCMKCTNLFGSVKPKDIRHQWDHKCDPATGLWSCTGNKHEDHKHCVMPHSRRGHMH